MLADEIDSLNNDITILRSDFKLSIIKGKEVDLDQLADDDSGLSDLHLELQVFLAELEQLIDPQIHDIVALKPTADADALSRFPRLAALRELIKICEPQDNSDPKEKPGTSAEAGKIRWYRAVVDRFNLVLDTILGDSAGMGSLETQILDYSPQDIEAIEHASIFASTCTSLFNQMGNSAICGSPHETKLHLSGFKRGQLRMDIRTCRETGPGSVYALFTRSPEEPEISSSPFDFSHLCSNSLEKEKLQFSFNSQGMWEQALDNSAELDHTFHFSGESYSPLDELLTYEDPLKLKYRELTAVLLASSLFQLSDSPWIERQFGPDTILVPPPDNKRIHQWCPQVVCDLSPKQNITRQGDSIAAFGVLLLEIEADRKVPWTEEDHDWDSGERSNHVRLCRALRLLKDFVGDNYRHAAKACLEYDKLVEMLDHRDIKPDRKGLAVIYKCILEPLIRQLVINFSGIVPLFKEMVGPWHRFAPRKIIPASRTAKEVFLFDDDESSRRPDEQASAQKFLNNLEPFFREIMCLRNPQDSLANLSDHERIRIAVLDSGVDHEDPMIRVAAQTKRIKVRKSFISQDWQDYYGHGTHVTRLLLKTAPSAEIYVGKICDNKVMNEESMSGIAKAIDWAVDEWDAHIISLSFGFQDENDLVEEAVQRAVDKNKLIFAAASNEGGVTGRARPARHRDVICIHSSDGKGNKGGMNPTPVRNADNFATLGVAVPSKWKRAEVWKSGTSFATPIAAGFAANVLEFSNYMCADIRPMKRKLLHRKAGMEAIFQNMAEKRDEYDFVYPLRLWQEGKSREEVARVIEDILRDI
ncbi:uncharacterized protein DNG_01669 [Cephalotrichum gorgonifer]|uniref:Peptidase S8/S53 domain-containing protein n=1 Tax=Cephalotrichum gorgonifer TaxID=2041049 RepID=A0AAE8MS14_9PEZI|nr:uncharacterized protein DNG_01669 [Cephalotrichum gorgonifer]